MVNQSATNLFLLGGDSGLRGYEVRRFDGTNRFLINIEDRLHFEREYYRLLRLGLAVFLDVGDAWGGTRTEEQRFCEFDVPNGSQRPRGFPHNAAPRGTFAETVTCSTRAVNVDNKFGNLKADVGFAILADIVRASAAGLVTNSPFPSMATSTIKAPF